MKKKVEQKNMRIGDNNIANGNKKVKEALHPDDIDLDDMNENIDIKEKVAQKNMRIGDNLFSLHLLRKFNRLFILKG